MLPGRLKSLLKKGQQGQSLVEFSLTAVVLLLIVSGLLDLGRLYFAYVALEDAAGEAALYLAMNPVCQDETSPLGDSDPLNDAYSALVSCTGHNNARWRALNATSGVLDNTQLTVNTNVPLLGFGNTVYVTVEYPYEFATPFISQIASGVTLTGSATQTIIAIPELPSP